MKHEYYTCDKCGQKLPNEQKLVLTVDYETDAAGDTDSIQKSIDICFQCLSKSVERWFSTKSIKERKEFINTLGVKE